MPVGVYPRSPGVGEAMRQRAARRRDQLRDTAEENTRLRARLQAHRTAIRRTTETIAAQRQLIEGIKAFRALLAELGDTSERWTSPACDASAHVLLASVVVGADADRIAFVTGLPRPVIVERELRLRASGIWRGRAVYAEWTKPDKALALSMDILVAEGAAYRSWDTCAYSVDPLPPAEIDAMSLRSDPETVQRDTRKHTTLTLAEARPCARCVAEPAYRGVCVDHILTVRTEDLVALWKCTTQAVYKRRSRILGRCTICRKEPAYSSGLCERHYRAEQAHALERRHRKRALWTISRQEVDRLTGLLPPAADPLTWADGDVRLALFDRLLYDLLRSVPEFEQGIGRPDRPPRPRRDLLFAMVTAVRLNASARGVEPTLNRARDAGRLSERISPNTLLTHLRDGSLLVPVAEQLIAAANDALAAFGVTGPAPAAVDALAIDPVASPLWSELVDLAKERQQKRAAAPTPLPADAPSGFRARLAMLVRGLAMLVSEVHRTRLHEEMLGFRDLAAVDS